MLVAVSEVLKNFLQSTVAAPIPQLDPKEWVQIAELNADTVADQNNRLILFLYAVEPDPYAVQSTRTGANGVQAKPLPLALHYLITFLSDSHSLDQRVLGNVIQAFHTEPLLLTRNYLDASRFEQFESRGELAEHIRVNLKSPEIDKVSHLWNSMRTGQRLALYYSVSVASVPDSARMGAPVIETAGHPNVGVIDPPEATD